MDATRLFDFLKTNFKIFGPFSIRILVGLLLGISSFLLFAKMTEDLLFNELQSFDQIVTNTIRYYSSDRLTKIMVFISALGSPFFLSIIGLFFTVYYMLIKKHQWDGLQVMIVLIGGTVINNILKIIFHRHRPTIRHLAQASGFSYPSGHAMISYAFYGLLIYLFWINVASRPIKYLLAVLLSILILSIGISRIYLGVHFPSDVIGGYAAGSFWLVACILSLRGIRYYKASSHK